MSDDSSLPALLRSALFVPGDKPRALDKALTLGADVVLIDLEDAVAPERKADARLNALSAIERFKAAGVPCVLRIAEPGDPALALDLPVAAQAQPDAVLVAKLDTPDQLTAVRTRLDDAGYAGPLWAMIETPLAIMNVDAIARQAALCRLQVLVAGANDLGADLKLPDGDTRRPALEPHLARLVLAARAMGLKVLDAVYNAYQDDAGLLAEAQRGRAMGFDGKTLIHPAQIAAVHTAFAPSAQERAWAERLCTAFEDPANAGKGAVALDGQMVEHMHWRAAKAILAAASQIKD